LYRSFNDTEYDENSEPERFEFNVNGKSIDVEMDSDEQPISMSRQAEDGSLYSRVDWNEEGDICYVKECRNFETRYYEVDEKLEIQIVPEKNVIYYEEKNNKKPRCQEI
jgi:hypothetical protein